MPYSATTRKEIDVQHKTANMHGKLYMRATPLTVRSRISGFQHQANTETPQCPRAMTGSEPIYFRQYR